MTTSIRLHISCDIFRHHNDNIIHPKKSFVNHFLSFPAPKVSIAMKASDVRHSRLSLTVSAVCELFLYRKVYHITIYNEIRITFLLRFPTASALRQRLSHGSCKCPCRQAQAPALRILLPPLYLRCS